MSTTPHQAAYIVDTIDIAGRIAIHNTATVIPTNKAAGTNTISTTSNLTGRIAV